MGKCPVGFRSCGKTFIPLLDYSRSHLYESQTEESHEVVMMMFYFTSLP